MACINFVTWAVCVVAVASIALTPSRPKHSPAAKNAEKIKTNSSFVGDSLPGGDHGTWKEPVVMDASKALQDYEPNFWWRDTVVLLSFVGLVGIIFEEEIGINKSAFVLLIMGIMWAVLGYAFKHMDKRLAETAFRTDVTEGLRETGGVVLFVLPSMALVEMIDQFDGFSMLYLGVHRFAKTSRLRLFIALAVTTFVLSAIIDNITSTIVMLKILRRLVAEDQELRRICGVVVVMASNAGGTWSPVGDVTTTMLWLAGKITATRTIQRLILPAIVSTALPLAAICRRYEPCWQGHKHELGTNVTDDVTGESVGALVLGMACILMSPLLKAWVEVPPYLGMLCGLGLYWLAMDLGHRQVRKLKAFQVEKQQGATSASYVTPKIPDPIQALRNIDMQSMLFLIGVLFGVGALSTSGSLDRYAHMLHNLFGSNVIALCGTLGISSAVVDNVPLVEAAIVMYAKMPCDEQFWQLLALTTGIGGSILSIGSASGVILMGQEGVGFLWYLKYGMPPALFGFVGGVFTFWLQHFIMYRSTTFVTVGF